MATKNSVARLSGKVALITGGSIGPVIHGDGGSLQCQSTCDGSADASAAAGDEGNLAA
jgi:hypothetical protein